MNKKLAIVLALAIVGVFAAVVVFSDDITESEFAQRVFRGQKNKNFTKLFTAWKKKHNKTYGGVEHQKRLNVFVANYHKVQRINNNKKFTFTATLNKFADLTSGEFSSIYTGLKKKRNMTKRAKAVNVDDMEVEIEDLRIRKVRLNGSVDWRTKNAVTPVKDQGQCGSCWAFSTTGSLEGLNAITSGKLLSFSEQQLVDCSSSYGNEGCDGGLMEDAMQYVQATGIQLEADYPYTAEDGDCAFDSSKVAFTNKGGYEDASSYKKLLAAVTLGPVSVSVEADQDAFQLYDGGVLNDDSCGTDLDHGVLAVGYDTDKASGLSYWIVKNSWGASWGNNGYLWIAATTDSDGICGINMDNCYPTA